MPGCVSCGRPVALARPSCLYCGAPLSPEQVAAAAGAAAALAAGPDSPASEAGCGERANRAGSRVLLVAELAAVSPEALARAAGLSRYEAALLTRRGGLHLLRALEAGAAAAVAERLGADGIRVFEVPEAEARVRPVRVASGERRGAVLALRGEEGSLEIRGEDLLLIVAGEIAREHLPRFARRRVDTARLAEGWRVHLHRAGERRPVEIDATNFSPGWTVSGSTRLELEAWLREIAPAAARDDRFGRLAPALAPAEPEPRGPLGAAGSLWSGVVPSRRGSPLEEAPALLDNVAQFRFYSGWRAAVERRLSSPPAPAAC